MSERSARTSCRSCRGDASQTRPAVSRPVAVPGVWSTYHDSPANLVANQSISLLPSQLLTTAAACSTYVLSGTAGTAAGLGSAPPSPGAASRHPGPAKSRRQTIGPWELIRVITHPLPHPAHRSPTSPFGPHRLPLRLRRGLGADTPTRTPEADGPSPRGRPAHPRPRPGQQGTSTAKRRMQELARAPGILLPERPRRPPLHHAQRACPRPARWARTESPCEAS